MSEAKYAADSLQVIYRPESTRMPGRHYHLVRLCTKTTDFACLSVQLPDLHKKSAWRFLLVSHRILCNTAHQVYKYAPS